MTRFIPLALLFALLAALAPAAPAPKEGGTPVITPANAKLVQPVLEVAKTVNRIRRGPKRGELVLYNGTNAAEVVDDVKLRHVRELIKGAQPGDVAISPDGKTVVWSGRGRTSYTVQPITGGKGVDIEIGEHAGYSAFSRDGKLVAIGYTLWARGGAGYSETRLYDLKGKLVRTLERTGAGAVMPVFSPDGKTLAVGNRNYETLLFDVATGKLLHRLDKRMTQEVAFSPDGKLLAAGYVDGTVGVWNVAAGKLLHEAPSGCKEVYSVDWSPKGDVLATCGREGKIVLWDAGRLARLKELDAPFWVIQARFTADGRRLITSSSEEYGGPKGRKVVVWSVPKGGK